MNAKIYKIFTLLLLFLFNSFFLRFSHIKYLNITKSLGKYFVYKVVGVQVNIMRKKPISLQKIQLKLEQTKIVADFCHCVVFFIT